MNVRVTPDPAQPSGHALIRVEGGAGSVARPGFRVQRDGEEQGKLGPGGWQTTDALLQPESAEAVGSDLVLHVGWGVCKHLISGVYEISVPDAGLPPTAVFWPDIVPQYEGAGDTVVARAAADALAVAAPAVAPPPPPASKPPPAAPPVAFVPPVVRPPPIPPPLPVQRPVVPIPVKRPWRGLKAVGLLLLLAILLAILGYWLSRRYPDMLTYTFPQPYDGPPPIPPEEPPNGSTEPQTSPARPTESGGPPPATMVPPPSATPPATPPSTTTRPPTTPPTTTPPPVTPPPPARTPAPLGGLTVPQVLAQAPNPAAIAAEGERRLHDHPDDGLLLLESAADRHDPGAAATLARLYDPGRHQAGDPVPPDPRQAARYYRDAARGGVDVAAPREALRRFLEQRSRGGDINAGLSLRDFWP